MLKTIFLGSRPFVFPILDCLFENSELMGIVTKPDAPAGRGEQLTPTPVKKYIQATHPDLPVLSPEKLDDDTYKHLEEMHPDLLVVAAYGLLIPKRFLDLPTRMTINIHPSLLPHLRGASPLQSAILEGLTETGVTIMKLDEKLDHGPIIKQETVSIESTDTFESLGEKSFAKATAILPGILEQIEKNTVELHAQDDLSATFCQTITRDEGFIDSNNPPDKGQIDRMIRAYYPWPGVWTKIKMKNEELRVKFYPEHMIQLEGKKKMHIKEFLNGYPEQREFMSRLF
jgi:methionyl-tRNA formyltransferase